VEETVFVGTTVPKWVFEKYAWTGEICLPYKGCYFWSAIKNQVVLATSDETRGGPRVILAWRKNGSEVQDVRKDVPQRHLKLVEQTEPDPASGTEVSEMPSEGPEVA
jgi:hypothetical protein